MLLQISSGQGPVECEFAVGLLFQALQKEYPDRFRFHAALPLPDVNAAIEEAVYALDELGAAGIKLASNARGQYLGDPALDPLFEVLNEKSAIKSSLLSDSIGNLPVKEQQRIFAVIETMIEYADK